MTQSNETTPAPLVVEQLRWCCDPQSLDFNTTDEVEPIRTVVGQDTAVEALRFGLECRAAGQNIFVRGLTGTGRVTLLKGLLEELQPSCSTGRDRCYVHNFERPDRPRLISLPRGRARVFRRLVDDLADFVRDDLRQALADNEAIRSRQAALQRSVEDQIKSLVGPFEQDAKAAGLAVVTLKLGPMTHTTLFPIVDDKPVPPEEFDQLHEQGQVSDEAYERAMREREALEQRLADINRTLQDFQHSQATAIRRLVETEARAVLRPCATRIMEAFPGDAVRAFVDALVGDIVENRLVPGAEEEDDFTRLYRVNVLLEQPANDHAAVIIENTPTVWNLLGGVDREVGLAGAFHSDHLMIRGGSLLQADGGYLIMEAREVLREPGAWKVLVRTLRSGRLEIVPPELALPWLAQTLKPEPIDIDVKVILLGDAGLFYALDAMDPDFPDLFKLLADFETDVPRDAQSIGYYAGVLAKVAREEELVPFDRGAVALLVEHGARVAACHDKLTARFGRLVDIAREAAFIAAKERRPHATAEDVREAVTRTKRRADLPSRRFRDRMRDGTIRIQADGHAVGQINGLAVLQAGPLVSGFPCRITSTIGPGTSGVVNIEREAELSGAIHTKGFFILGGLLRFLLQTDHPLAFSASIAFEQSYGGIDGDSASGAEMCCLLSALTGLPLRQGLAMTGAIDQVGNVMAIGAVNEKIEGFFDTCADVGLTGDQGVIIPGANVGDLMLREDVVEACRQGRFAVYAVDTVHQALELLTGRTAGRRGEDGAYPEGTALGLAVERAREFWERAATPPAARNGDAEAK
jgi:ATP-dependent Lon protease